MNKKERHGLYEGLFILNPNLSEEGRERALARIGNDIETRNGKIQKVIFWERKRFAYEMDGFREGYYYVVYFNAKTDLLPEVYRDCNLNEDLIRYTVIAADNIPEEDEIKFKSLVTS